MRGALIDIVSFVLVLVTVGAVVGVIWSQALLWQRQRVMGYRFWLINPMAQLAGTFTKETAISLACLLIAVAATIARNALAG